ncbi:Potassium-transporting ATPase KdpC subunit [Chryseobacterium aquaeductus]|uniref:Potassium-transporting ATPase KdpC subunit n=1 Tax=Chryseobacterium aquaeductus TaxID=2675056 RepID=A0A9N8MIR2_9FLAO|nr:K(+)-transporting ATPase subunit C [Chryseobacterium aquaeductus]CAA7331908.1 Potassium-transporting ATPase KdpC subunit [Chryseobacterium potabilaquae]CAD7813221.1 Potassium-transporting ATPase KdpC subunit [Chryseobacterium aquaeductus]
MKKHILPAIKLTVLCIILFTVIYPVSIWAIAQLSDNQGRGEIIEHNGKTYYANIGQSFTSDKYFNSRPSAVDYNAAGSAGSNKGPSNDEYLKQVQARIDTILMKNPGITKSQIPADLVTASGSGLDPNFSVQAAKIQAERIAKIRNIDVVKINNLIAQHTDKPLIGLFGPEKINVLKLNIALDGLK